LFYCFQNLFSNQSTKRLYQSPVESEFFSAFRVETLDARFGRQTSFAFRFVEREIPDGFSKTFFVKFSKILRIDFSQIAFNRPKFSRQTEQQFPIFAFAQHFKPKPLHFAQSYLARRQSAQAKPPQKKGVVINYFSLQTFLLNLSQAAQNRAADSTFKFSINKILRA